MILLSTCIIWNYLFLYADIQKETTLSSIVEPTALQSFSQGGVPATPSKNEVPTVSAVCDPAVGGRKYENGSAVLMVLQYIKGT